MNYELTINRVGVFATDDASYGDDASLLSGDALVATFRKLAEEIYSSKAFQRIEHAALKVVQKKDENAICSREGLGPGNSMEVIEIFPMPLDSVYVPSEVRDNTSDHLVCLLPSKKILCRVDGTPWTVRMRASMTACALKRKNGLSKLWWTFEGIPTDKDPERRPTEKSAAKFLAVSDKMAAAVVDPFFELYRYELTKVRADAPKAFKLLPDKIRISLSDSNERPVTKLIDEMHFAKVSFSKAKSSNDPQLLEGSKEFERFIDEVTEHGSPVNDDTVTINSELTGIRALLCQYQDAKQHELRVTGIARRNGTRAGYDLLSPEQQREQKSEGFLRSVSGARPVSAMLASQHAILFEAERNKRLREQRAVSGAHPA